MSHDLLTTREVAKVLGVGTTSIKRWADSGLLRCVKTPGGHRRFPREAVDAFLAQNRQESKAAILSPSHIAEGWLSHLTNGATPDSVYQMLQAERRERQSWFAAAESVAGLLAELGRSWARGDISVIQEHIATERLIRAITRCANALDVPDDARRCLLMVAEADDHTLGLHLTELCLREVGWQTTWVGRKTPVHFACEFISTGSLDMVAVSASEHSRDAASLADQADRLGYACERKRVPLVLGGGGLWPEKPRYGIRVRAFAEFEALVTDYS